MMKLFNDKSQIFECKVKVDDNIPISISRLMLIPESTDISIAFNGKIDSEGNCKINIPALGKYSVSKTGQLVFEVVVENTLFQPWKENYNIMQALKVESVQTKASQEKIQPKVQVIVKKENKARPLINKAKLYIESLEGKKLIEFANKIKKAKIQKEDIQKIKKCLLPQKIDSVNAKALLLALTEIKIN